MNPVSANAEVGIIEHSYYGVAGAGGFAALGKFKSEYGEKDQLFGTKYTYLMIGIQGKYHFVIKKYLDVYCGILTGYFFTNTRMYGPTNYNLQKDKFNEVLFHVHLGFRYYFPRKHLGICVEAGYGYTIFNLGLSYKLKFQKLPYKKQH